MEVFLLKQIIYIIKMVFVVLKIQQSACMDLILILISLKNH